MGNVYEKHLYDCMLCGDAPEPLDTNYETQCQQSRCPQSLGSYTIDQWQEVNKPATVAYKYSKVHSCIKCGSRAVVTINEHAFCENVHCDNRQIGIDIADCYTIEQWQEQNKPPEPAGLLPEEYKQAIYAQVYLDTLQELREPESVLPLQGSWIALSTMLQAEQCINCGELICDRLCYKHENTGRIYCRSCYSGVLDK